MSTIENSFISKAHLLVKKALESEEFGLIDEAIEYHTQAANYFNLAVLQTSNEQTISALKILSQTHISKANDLKQFQDFNNKPIASSSNVISSNSSIINYASPVTPTTESLLNYPSQPIITNINPITNNENSPTSNWFGIEKLMDILPKPQIFQRNNNNNNEKRKISQRNTDSCGIVDGSLLNSFYLVESDESPFLNYNNLQQQNNLDSEVNNNYNVEPSIMEVEKIDNSIKLQQELNLVNQTVKVLIDENERNARYLRTITQENIYLKRCIIQFRQEIEKKTKMNFTSITGDNFGYSTTSNSSGSSNNSSSGNIIHNNDKLSTSLFSFSNNNNNNNNNINNSLKNIRSNDDKQSLSNY